jgi:hypothetical protein
MFNATIDLFLPGGELRAVLEQFALALLRHDAEARKVVGPYNRISGSLKRAAHAANIFSTGLDMCLGKKCYYRHGLEFIQFISTTNKVLAFPKSFSLFQRPTKY